MGILAKRGHLGGPSPNKPGIRPLPVEIPDLSIMADNPLIPGPKGVQKGSFWDPFWTPFGPQKGHFTLKMKTLEPRRGPKGGPK